MTLSSNPSTPSRSAKPVTATLGPLDRMARELLESCATVRLARSFARGRGRLGGAPDQVWVPGTRHLTGEVKTLSRQPVCRRLQHPFIKSARMLQCDGFKCELGEVAIDKHSKAVGDLAQNEI